MPHELLVDELRRLSGADEAKSSPHEDSLAESIRKARAALLDEAAKKRKPHEAVIFTVTNLDGLIDLSMIQVPGEGDLLGSTNLRQQYGARSVDDLRGLAARLRDHFVSEGLRLSLRFAVRGETCNARHLAWDIVASW